jgi:hypothetical protein
VQQKKNQVHYEKTENCLYLEIRKKLKTRKRRNRLKVENPTKFKGKQQGD